jgi:proteasome lid subunit RPN8/RPN11
MSTDRDTRSTDREERNMDERYMVSVTIATIDGEHIATFPKRYRHRDDADATAEYIYDGAASKGNAGIITATRVLDTWQPRAHQTVTRVDADGITSYAPDEEPIRPTPNPAERHHADVVRRRAAAAESYKAQREAIMEQRDIADRRVLAAIVHSHPTARTAAENDRADLEAELFELDAQAVTAGLIPDPEERDEARMMAEPFPNAYGGPLGGRQ